MSQRSPAAILRALALGGFIVGGCRGGAVPVASAVVEPNDFFVGDDALREKPVEALLGSFKRHADGGAFYAIGDAVEIFTKYAWRSRPAAEEDLAIGVRAACFLSKAPAAAECGEGVQNGPRTRAEALTRPWVLGTLKAPALRGVVSVGGCRCDVRGVRILQQ